MTNNQKNNHIIQGLRALYRGEDKDYEAFFKSAATRHRNRWTTSIENMRKMFDGSYEDAKIVAKEMQKLGVGNYIWGRHGAESRVVWKFRLDSIGQVAVGQHEDLVEKDADTEAEEESDDDAVRAPDGYLSHNFTLRLNETITLNLPADLTETEANRLAEFVKALPFERS
jgi:hypothetical protein